MSSITIPSVQIISFYETSSIPFTINLDELDRDIKYLTESISNGQTVKVIFILGYKQTNNATTSTGGSKVLDRFFRIEVPLKLEQVNTLLSIYSTIRNIGSLNPDRSLSSLPNLQLTFDMGIVGVSNTAHKVAEQRESHTNSRQQLLR